MRTVVECAEDAASVGIVRALRARARWTEGPLFLDRPTWTANGLRIVTIPSLHIYRERLDSELQAAGLSPDLLVFASRHAAKSGRDSLTVHPIGNWQDALYGGRPHDFVPASARDQSHALRRLLLHAAGLGYQVTFEATHHGPWLSTPAFFIEVGSGLSAWEDPAAHEAIARTILDLPLAPEHPVALGVGGGHYAPRHLDLVRRRRVDIGHIASDHALEGSVTDNTWRSAFEKSATRDFVVDDRSPHAEAIESRLFRLGFRRRRIEEFEERPPSVSQV